MKQFALLHAAIDATTSTNRKVDAMAEYFAGAAPADAAWAVHFLAGERPKRLVPVRRLAAWAMEESGVPAWLFDECYEAVGDLAETIALLLPPPVSRSDRPLHEWVELVLLPLAGMPEEEQRVVMLDAWRQLAEGERFIWNKLITGGFRIGVSELLVVRALTRASGIPEGVLAHRLSGHWTPTAASFAALTRADSSDADRSRPYPFFLAHALEGGPETLGDVGEWQAEWKWDGIRAQVIRRAGESHVWSRGGELVTARFPELAAAAVTLTEGTVLDGEIVPWKDGAVMSFAQLQRRIGRKSPSAKILSDVPVALIAYDILEKEGRDIRGESLAERLRALSGELGHASPPFMTSPVVTLHDWSDARDAHERARERGAEGLMLKRLDSAYGVGRRKGGWWKWKVQPYSVDAVMVYAQAGHGRRALLHTDYTFAVRDGDGLVPFAKAYSGLTDEEIRTLDAWIRRHTVEKFGPVRHVEPVQVFEIVFEGIQRSPRHKSGVAVRFPRIARWRTDKLAADIDTVGMLRQLLERVT